MRSFAEPDELPCRTGPTISFYVGTRAHAPRRRLERPFPSPVPGVEEDQGRVIPVHGEAIVYDGKGLPSFALFHSHECSWNSKLRGRFSSMAQRWQDKSLEVIVLS
jgi:hypothetical protein